MTVDLLYFALLYIAGVTTFFAFWFGSGWLNDLYDRTLP